MNIKKKVIIFGINSFAEVAYENFTHDSNYEVVAFTVTDEYLVIDSYLNLPVVAFENLQKKFSPMEHCIYVAIAYKKLNRTRTHFVEKVKKMGYSLATFISSKANLWRNVTIGEHCFILEQNNIQVSVKIGNNVILWSGNHIGHHSVIGDNCFLSSHVVVSGNCKIGNNCFLGVNSTLSDGILIEEDTWIGPASNVQSSIKGGYMYRAESLRLSRITTKKFFKF
jgi:sugar O-acyltransferase (sialic acid O-acetyltransferase NeuD family)